MEDDDDVRILSDQWYLDRLGRHHSKTFLRDGENSIGRAITSRIVLDSPFASRNHCIITLRNGILGLEDLNSFNGTFVNDLEIKGRSCEVKLGDVIAIGGLMKEYDIEYRSDVFMFRLRNEALETENDRNTVEFDNNPKENAVMNISGIKKEEPSTEAPDLPTDQDSVIEIFDDEDGIMYSMQVLSQMDEDVQETVVKIEKESDDDGEKTVVNFGNTTPTHIVDLISDDEEERCLNRDVDKWLSKLSQSQHNEVLKKKVKTERHDEPIETSEEPIARPEESPETVLPAKELRIVISPLKLPVSPKRFPAPQSPAESSEDEIIPPKKRRQSVIFSSDSLSPCGDNTLQEFADEDIPMAKDQNDIAMPRDAVDPSGLLRLIAEEKPKSHDKKHKKKHKHRSKVENKDGMKDKKKEEKRDVNNDMRKNEKKDEKKVEKKKHDKKEAMKPDKKQEKSEKHDRKEDKFPSPELLLKKKLERSASTRKPPEIIPAPIKARRNSLRGFCASEMGKSGKKITLSGVLKQNEVKSVPEIIRTKEIKETRREILRNLSKAGAEEENKGTAQKAPTKIKLTWENRGTFLTEDIPKKPIPSRRQSFDASLSAADNFAPARITRRRKTVSNLNDDDMGEMDNTEDVRVEMPLKLPEYAASLYKNVGTHIRPKIRIAHNAKPIVEEKMKDNVSPKVKFRDINEPTESGKSTTITFAEPLQAFYEFCPSPVTQDAEPDVLWLRKDDVQNEITKWDPMWLNKNDRNIMDLVSYLRPLLRIGNTFDDFSSYVDTMIPLVCLDLWTRIEQNANINSLTNQTNKRILLNIVSVTNSNGRFVIKAQNISSGRLENIWNGDLVKMECQYKRKSQNFFVYTKHIESDGIMVTFETAFMNLDASIENTVVHVERIMNISGAMINVENVFDLVESPLCAIILDATKLNDDDYGDAYKVKAPFEYHGKDPLNSRQLEAIERIHSHCLNPQGTIDLIEGAPGTGKTRIIANLVFQLLLQKSRLFPDMKILICAPSNTAVDHVAFKMMYIRETLPPEIKRSIQIVRFGTDSRFSPNLKCISIDEVANQYKASMIKEGTNDPKIKKCYEMKIKEYKSRLASLAMPAHERYTEKSNDIDEEQSSLNRKITELTQFLNNEDFGKQYVNERVLGNANVICTTLSSCGRLAKFGVDSFDVCIVDEAAQANELLSLAPLKFGVSSLVLVGDPLQLPVNVVSTEAKQHGLGQSLFKRLSLSDTIPINYLTEQYRMHPEICKFPSEHFYDNRLYTHPMAIDDNFPWATYGVFSLEYAERQTKDKIMSSSEESNFVSTLLTIMTRMAPSSKYSYGIITPYVNQRDDLHNKISAISKDILISTIDGYQGQERDIIIISLAKTEGISYLAHTQRLNVALTRAKKCLYVCGNFIRHQPSGIGQRFVNDAKKRSVFHIVNSLNENVLQNFITKVK